MSALENWLRTELTGWKPWSVIWLVIATAVIVGVSIYGQDNWMSLVTGLTGVWCVILTGMGKRSSFLFGVVNTIFYALISWNAKYYGEVMLNLLYYLPMNFVGWFVWKKHMDEKAGEVIKRGLGLKKSIYIYGVTAIAIAVYGYILYCLEGNLPFVDSMSTVVSVVAQILSIRRLKEQWVLWIVVDIVTIIMWAIHYAQNNGNLATLAMWSVFLVNACIMYMRWHREAAKHAV